MKIYIRTLCVFILLAIASLVQAQTPNPNIRLYGFISTFALQMGPNMWGSSNYENMLYTNLDRNACTDYIIFNANFNTDGTMKMASDWYPSTGNTAWGQSYFQVPKRRFLNDWLHAAGKKVHLCFFVSGNGSDWTTELSSSTIRTAMCKTIADSVVGSTNRYDGVNFDVEPLGTGDTANVRLFLTQLRDTLNHYHQWVDTTQKPEISICFFDQWTQSKFWGSVSSLLTSIQHMSYNMMGNYESISWYNAPVYSTGYTDASYNVASIDSYTAEFIANGIPRSKLVMACPFNYNVFQGGTTTGSEGCSAPFQPFTSVNYPTWMLYNASGQLVSGYSGSEMYYYLWNAFLDTATTTVHYDNIRKAAWAGVNATGNANDFFIGFQDTTCVRENLQYVSSQGLQGAMIWEIGGAYINSPNQTRHPGLAPDHLLQAAKKTRLNLMSTTVNPSPTKSVITSNPNQIVANGTATSTITVQLKDSTGNNITTGGFTVSLTTTMGALGTVKDNGNGTCTATLTSSTTSGTATITGTVSSQTITNNATVQFQGTLPVQLTSFNGAVKGRTVSLVWKTATEVNSYSFQVERRITGSWETIGQVSAQGVSNIPTEYTYSDNNQNLAAISIRYRLKEVNNDGSFVYSGEVELNVYPSMYTLKGNYPNPFNPQTKIGYTLPENAHVRLVVYDVLGREVMELVNENQAPGYYEKSFNGLNLSSGVYFYRLMAEGNSAFTQIKKMVLMK